MAHAWRRSMLALGGFLGLLCAWPLDLAAQAPVESAAIHRLRLSLQDQARDLLARDGITFYALGALLNPDGAIEEFGPDHWPALEAPPAEWQDSLIVGFHGIDRPVQAVAMLIDLGRSTSPADTFANFHGETATECTQFRIPILGMAISSVVRWGVPLPQPCTPLLGLAGASASLSGPLRAELLTQGSFVAFTLVWQVGVPGGDPIAFHTNGTVVNAKAGLAGRWTIQDDSTLIIAGPEGPLAGKPYIFRLRGGKLISPPTAPQGSNGTWWIETAGGKR